MGGGGGAMGGGGILSDDTDFRLVCGVLDDNSFFKKKQIKK